VNALSLESSLWLTLNQVYMKAFTFLDHTLVSAQINVSMGALYGVDQSYVNFLEFSQFYLLVSGP
jgi:hypothetical protein